MLCTEYMGEFIEINQTNDFIAERQQAFEGQPPDSSCVLLHAGERCRVANAIAARTP